MGTEWPSRQPDQRAGDKRIEMKNVVVLGAGMVGGAMAADLCHDYAVTVVDAVGRRTLWHMPSGVLGTYPDDALGEESGDLTWGLSGVVVDAEV